MFYKGILFNFRQIDDIRVNQRVYLNKNVVRGQYATTLSFVLIFLTDCFDKYIGCHK